MPESCAMPPEEITIKSPLEKPLHQLTEDDIAQVTREDCRRYLKEKGMRRPSWNKSQAIQQVIMLKALLEKTPDSEGGSCKKLRISRPKNTQSSNNAILESVPKETSGDPENSLSADETMPYCRKDMDRPDSSGCISCHLAATNNESAQPRTPGSTNMPIGQMTIFYCGKVNVYDEIPADKARALMHIAASPLQLPDEQPVLTKPFISNARPDSFAILPTHQTVKMSDNSSVLHEESHVEGPSTRKASVQRYLEKRKDRFKSKGKAGMTSYESLDMNFNHQIPRNETCSISQIRQPSTPARCSLVETDSVKKVCLSTALHNKGV